MKAVTGWSAGMLILTMVSVDVCRAQRIYLARDRFDVTIEADTIPAGGIPILLRSTEMGGTSNAAIPFKASESSTHLPPEGPRFLLVTPSRGTTPANVVLGLDPQVVPFLRPGVYAGTFSYLVDGPENPRERAASTRFA